MIESNEPNSNEPNSGEQARFEQWIIDARFDDAVREDHQEELREKSLQAFDRSQERRTDAERVITRSGPGTWTAVRWMGVAVAVAVCLLAMGTLWFAGGDDPNGKPATQLPNDSNDAAAPMLLALIADVDSFRGEIPVEKFYDALAICQQEHEARQLDLARK